MSRQYLIRLPWPSADLNANRKGHWAKKARATKEARRAAWALALQEKLPKMPEAILEFSFFPPDRRKRDTQNLPGMMKAYIDGIADAMGCDDNGFLPRFPDHLSEPVKGGAVLVLVRGVQVDNWRSIGEVAARMTEAAE